MESVRYANEQIIAKKKETIKRWYIIQEGAVIQKFNFSQIRLGKNSVIGMSEKDMFLCDYIAEGDVVLTEFACESAADINNLLNKQEGIRSILLKAILEQRHNMLCLYSELYNKSNQFQVFVEKIYNDYKILCNHYRLEEQPFMRIEHFSHLEMRHKAESWEVNNSLSIVKNYLNDYISLMEKDNSLTIGVIMEACAQTRRFELGIYEMENYLLYNKDILLSENSNDIFNLFFALSIEAYEKKFDIEPIKKEINLIPMFAEKLNVFNQRTISRRLNEFKNYDYANIAKDSGAKNPRKEINILEEDCLSHILCYAGYNDTDADEICTKIEKYRDLPDRASSDNAVYALRRELTAIYYDIYYRTFIRAVKDESTLTPVIDMFLNFGFMDVSFISEEHAQALYELSAHLNICNSDNIYTMYNWLKCVYSGEKEPSKNEFDMTYAAYLADLRKNAKITQAELDEYMHSPEKKVEYEIKNMFTSVNKATYGKFTTFCPILCEDDLIGDIEKMLLTAERIENSVNEIRKIDYSVFYREIMFSDTDHGINCERIMKEVLPDIILMPNAGSRSMMWQEISGAKSDTPGRFMLPIFTVVDLDELMLDLIGRFRWEMCRRIQGIHWNDIREKSLTAEYCSYLQFYKKNSDLSSDAKEKIKLSLGRAKNNYREVFVKDYICWIRFESKGSFRLNKLSREILVQYCPFAKAIRDELKSNPIHQTAITKFETEAAKQLRRYTGVYDKYVKAGGVITAELKDNLLFYQM